MDGDDKMLGARNVDLDELFWAKNSFPWTLSNALVIKPVLLAENHFQWETNPAHNKHEYCFSDIRLVLSLQRN